MSRLGDVFADTLYFIGLVSRNDQHHARARAWSRQVDGRIVTTRAVLFEVLSALARPTWRAAGVVLVEDLLARSDVDVHDVDDDLWTAGWDLYRARSDKAWSLTDYVSFEVMREEGLSDALTADDHFRQAGFRAVLLEEPT